MRSGMLKKLGYVAASLGLALALVGCGSDSESGSSAGDSSASAEEKGGYTKDEFVETFKGDFGETEGLAESKLDCVGGQAYDSLSADTVKAIQEDEIDEEAGFPEDAVQGLSAALADCLDLADLLAVAGETGAGVDAECLNSKVEVSNEDEAEFWAQSLNGETPTGEFMTAVVEAQTACAAEG